MVDLPKDKDNPPPKLAPWREKIHEVIFGHDTPAGMAFDVALLLAILASVTAVMLETVEAVDARYHRELLIIEVGFTVLFTIEYVLRLICVRRPWRYARSFFGVVDLISILPTYLLFVLSGAQSLAIVRALRLLRVFRILKLTRLMREGAELRDAVWQARGKVVVFLLAMLVVVSIVGSLMYLVEGRVYQNPGFDSIPQSVYWAVVTMTTVGYGDAVATSVIGKMLSSLLIILGYSLIIVPTGFVSATIARHERETGLACARCTKLTHAAGATYCDRCGDRLGRGDDAKG